MSVRIMPLPLKGRWKDFLGNLPSNSGWSILLTGGPGTGKSTWTLMLCEQLANIGTTVYCFAEETIEAGTIQERADLAKIRNRQFYVPVVTKITEIRDMLQSGQFRFCVIDSINCIDDATDDEVMALVKEFPDIGFVFIAQTTKDRRSARGRGTNEHMAYVVLKSVVKGTSRYIITEKNRYGPKAHEFFVFDKR
jgi:predicted ATP-dependent serine protease